MRRAGALIVAALLPCSGCGTFLNTNGAEALMLDSRPAEARREFERPPFPFGGVANDVKWMKNADQPISFLAAAADLPFSLVGDVVTLPWMTYLWISSSPSDSLSPPRTDF